jgi:hypothetical protein
LLAQDTEAVLGKFGGLVEAPEVAQTEGQSGNGFRLPGGYSRLVDDGSRDSCGEDSSEHG